MIDYRAGEWGFHIALGWSGSLAPRALTMAIPNAIVTFVVATMIKDDIDWKNKSTADASQAAMAIITSTMIFILYNRSRTSYNRWWEGGTLLQKTRGEWFNAYSSIMAFTSTKPEMHEQVEAYTHLLARLMSLLMCCGLQQVSPNRERPFPIIELDGIEPESMEFLNSAPDKVEIILQWIQRSMILHMQSGVLPVAPPILSRAFQEVSRGIVNLQNARKIADFPYPYPLAQISMILQLLHYVMIPFIAALAASRGFAVFLSFFSIFVLWCIHFNALDLEFPFGSKVNDLPMVEMQQDWNKSICTLLEDLATRPPKFDYNHKTHKELTIQMSDASTLYDPESSVMNKGHSNITIQRKNARFFPSQLSEASHVEAKSKKLPSPNGIGRQVDTGQSHAVAEEPALSPRSRDNQAQRNLFLAAAGNLPKETSSPALGKDEAASALSSSVPNSIEGGPDTKVIGRRPQEEQNAPTETVASKGGPDTSTSEQGRQDDRNLATIRHASSPGSSTGPSSITGGRADTQARHINIEM